MIRSRWNNSHYYCPSTWSNDPFYPYPKWPKHLYHSTQHEKMIQLYMEKWSITPCPTWSNYPSTTQYVKVILPTPSIKWSVPPHPTWYKNLSHLTPLNPKVCSTPPHTTWPSEPFHLTRLDEIIRSAPPFSQITTRSALPNDTLHDKVIRSTSPHLIRGFIGGGWNIHVKYKWICILFFPYFVFLSQYCLCF